MAIVMDNESGLITRIRDHRTRRIRLIVGSMTSGVTIDPAKNLAERSVFFDTQ